jgi:hypothetical protein
MSALPLHLLDTRRRRRAAKQLRVARREAIRGEFELERPRGLAEFRALARNVGSLEAERFRTREAAIAESARAARGARSVSAAR